MRTQFKILALAAWTDPRGSAGVATPSPYGSFIHYTSLVIPAHKEEGLCCGPLFD
jgi:hypothetical protein